MAGGGDADDVSGRGAPALVERGKRGEEGSWEARALATDPTVGSESGGERTRREERADASVITGFVFRNTTPPRSRARARTLARALSFSL